MPVAKIDNTIFYPEDYDYSYYYENEIQKYKSPIQIFKKSSQDPEDPSSFQSTNYINERKCPIYVHSIKKDSDVYNNYNRKLANSTKVNGYPQNSFESQNASKFVLDKLEETYWATWKPKKEGRFIKKLRSPRRATKINSFDSRIIPQEHVKAFKKESNRPLGDKNVNIIKYFKAKHFDSNSTTNAGLQEPKDKKSNLAIKSKTTIEKEGKLNEKLTSDMHNRPVSQGKINKPNKSKNIFKIDKQDSVSQEIQTIVHCPVILEENKIELETDLAEIEYEEKIEDWHKRNDEQAQNKAEQKKSVIKTKKGKKKSMKDNTKQKKNHSMANGSKELSMVSESLSDDRSESLNTFIEHKDSLEITKIKQENASPKEHVQQPKCIRLYRKSGLTAGYIKGGTYPLKSCLKKDGAFKGNFKLGAPGSPLFVTTNSFVNKKRK